MIRSLGASLPLEAAVDEQVEATVPPLVGWFLHGESAVLGGVPNMPKGRMHRRECHGLGRVS